MGELQTIVTDLCKKDFNYAVCTLKQRLAQASRCVVCTLPLPCLHYSTASEMPPTEVPALAELPLFKLAEGIQPEFLQQEVVRDSQSVLRINFKSSPRKRLNLPTPKRLRTLQAIATFKERQIKAELQQIEQSQQAEAEAKAKQQRDHQRLLSRNRKLKALIREHVQSDACQLQPGKAVSVKPSPRHVRLSPITRV